MEEPIEGYGCANLDERWRCPVCGASWFGTLNDRGCPHCGASMDLIELVEADA